MARKFLPIRTNRVPHFIAKERFVHSSNINLIFELRKYFHMNTSEKIASVFISILLLLVVALSVRLLNTRESIGEVEAERNKIHSQRILVYDNRILMLNDLISTLQTENDSLRNEKAKVDSIFIHEIDSISRLPFNGKSNFWTTETTRIDSIRRRYLSRY